MIIKTLNGNIYLSSKDEPGTTYLSISGCNGEYIKLSLNIDNMQSMVNFLNSRIDEYRESRSVSYEMGEHDKDYANHEHNHED